ncbi:hypothetical protein J2X63_003219 [Agromyces sp. 3263]|uniref:hypothetical protein n=1 Tax=Agromyces sp. 3263 TaxID=2817750 RepID=UPI00286761CF|nr:hypothetical protein [Agromyces sp. 3263]MDR6907511.1 hypothetical protein [Agromyces sp. 3263]
MNNLGTWTGRDPLVDEDGAYENTPEQLSAALTVARRYADRDPELLAMLGLIP